MVSNICNFHPLSIPITPSAKLCATIPHHPSLCNHPPKAKAKQGSI